MATAPLSIKLRCASWQQLSTIYKRDLSRQAMFLKSASPPPIGTPVRIDLTLPSESMVVLNGVVHEHVGAGGMGGRGPGVDIKLAAIPQSAMWLIETALAAQKDSRIPTAAVAAVQVAKTMDPAAEAHVDDGREMVEAEGELVTALSAELTSLQKLNAFQVLGVGYEVNDSEVRAAFGELTKRYHPDRYARYPSTELRSLAAEIFIVIRDAYRRIGDETTRGQTLAQLGRTPAPRVVATPRMPSAANRGSNSGFAKLPTPKAISTTPGPGGGPDAPGDMPRAVVGTSPAPPPRPVGPARAATRPPLPRAATPPPVAMPTPQAPPSTPPAPAGAAGRGQLPRAATPAPVAAPAGRATPRPPGSPSTEESGRMELASIDSLLDDGRIDEALTQCRAYAKLHPGDRIARACVELAEGMRAMANRDRMEAAQRFEAVLELDPSNERAARELAEMRRQATNERKGLLTKLLGKKE